MCTSQMTNVVAVYPPRWSWPRRSQSGFPRLPPPLRSPLPSWSSCPPSYRSQPFLSAEATRHAVSRLDIHTHITRVWFIQNQG